MAHIYKITNLINDRKYVGQTVGDPKIRWYNHLYCAKNNPLMVISHAIAKHGEDNFKFEVIENCSEENLNDREIYWIKELNTFHDGYNSNEGGGGNSGYKMKRGAVHPDAKAVDCYDLEGTYLCSYDSIGQAAWELTQVNSSNPIMQNIKGITSNAFGYRWALKGEPLKEWDGTGKKIPRKRGKVYGINLKSGRKKMWKSVADAAEELEGNRKNNAPITYAVNRNDKEDTTKTKVKDWYLFRNKQIALADWKPAEPNKFTHEQAVDAGKSTRGIPRPANWKPIKGVNIETGEIVEFNHAMDAVKSLRSETCKVTQTGINRCCKHTERGELTYTNIRWNGLNKPYQNGGYTWYYNIDVNK